MRKIAILAAVFFSLTLSAAPRAAEQVAALTPADQATVAKVQEALNSIHTLKSHFVQASSNGSVVEGELYLSRPGKLRINYQPPAKMQLVVQGGYLIQVDLKLGTLTYIPLSRTPAAMLVQDDLRLGGDKVSVTGIARANGLIHVGMVQPGKEDEGSLTMTFNEGNLALRQWSVVDAQGVETRVTLTDPQVNTALDPHVFDFDASKFDQNRFD
jgi:outer membrane lipoprotein-sorting protein